MLGHVRGIDHAVILVRDLDRARDTYARLGFTLTPRGFHSLGSQNHCIMFGRDYLELMALPATPPAAFRYFADFLAKGEGVGALAFATDDAPPRTPSLTQAGIARGSAARVIAPGRESGGGALHPRSTAAGRDAGLPQLRLPAPHAGHRVAAGVSAPRERRCWDQIRNDCDSRSRALRARP